MLTLFAIVIVAFALRFAFAYGVSAGDNFALSGGTSAVSHRRIITEILAGTYSPGNEIALNYPYGGVSISGPLFDYFMAVWAKLFTFFGLSNDAAAGAALAWSAPIFGALTCIPVFLIAVRLFKDEIVGLLSAGFYAAFAILIMTTPFSYGTETPMLCFLIAWLVYFLGTAYTVADEHNIATGEAAFADKVFLKWTILSAVMMACIVLTWPGFWAIMMTAAVMTFFTLLFARLGGKSMAPTVFLINTVLIVGAFAGACYYIPFGMWETVFSGGFIVTICTVAYSVLFLFLEKKPWVLSIPVTAIVMIAVAVVLYFVAPDLSRAALTGNTMYSGELMAALVSETTRTRISAMASYYGWLTLWFPLIFGVWMFYNYRKNIKSSAYTFAMLWMLASYCVGWYNASYAVLAGAGFAVGSAILIVTVFRAVNLKSYLRSLRGNGVKAGARKALDFFPLTTVIIAVGLIAVPAAVFAVDAATPTNSEGPDYFGGLGYTVSTSDSSLVNGAWTNSSSYATKEKTLLSWYGYSDTASSLGGFKTVTSSIGNGTSAMATAFYADSSSAVIATLVLRLVEENPAAQKDKFVSALGVEKADKFMELVTDESKAREYMTSNLSEFTGYNAVPAADVLSYIVGAQYLSSNLNEAQVAALYDSIVAATGSCINYIEVDAGMIPVYYGDGSYANSVAYFGDYALGDFGNPTMFYEVTSTTQQYYQMGYMDRLYYTYNDALYDTFLWNAVMGVTPATYGESSNIALLSDISNSDGSVRATPGTGFGHFKLVYWHLNYRASEDADWVEMDATEAIAKQNAEGGFINYLSSVVVYEYVSETLTDITVTDGTAPVSNVKVAVFTKLKEGDVGYDSSGTVTYVQTSTGFTGDDGIAKVAIPSDHEYLVRFYVGASGIRDGTLVYTQSDSAARVLAKAAIVGKLVDSEGNLVATSDCTVSYIGSDGVTKEANVAVTAGTAANVDLVPDVYTVVVYGKDGSKINSTSVTVVSDATLAIQSGAGKIELTLKDAYGNDVTADMLPTTKAVIKSSSGVETEISATPAYVLPGDYTVYVSGGSYISASSAVSVSKGETAKVELTLYAATAAGTAGHTAMGMGYSAIYGGTASVPSTASAYIVDYYVDSAMKKVSGTLKFSGSETAGTLVFINGASSYVFTAGTDGKFAAYLPVGVYDVLAYSTSGAAYLEQGFNIADTVENKEISMGDGYKATFTVNFQTKVSSSTKGIAYLPITLTVVHAEKTYTMHPITDANGNATVYLPAGAVVTYMLEASVINTNYDRLNMESDWTGNVTVNNAVTQTLSFVNSADTGNYVKKIEDMSTVTFNADGSPASGFFRFSGTDSFYAEIASGHITGMWSDKDKANVIDMKFRAGSYTVYSASDDKYVSSKSIVIYPTATTVDLDIVDVFKVSVTKDSGATMEVIALPYDAGTEVKYGSVFTDSSTVKYLEKDGTNYKYYVVVKSTDSKIFISEIMDGSSATYDVDATALADMKVLKGYVGSSVSGYMTGVFNTSYQFYTKVTSGEYSIELPVNAVVSEMYVDASITSGANKYSTDKAVDICDADITVDGDKTQNFAMATAVTSASEDYEITVANLDATAGTGNVTVRFANAGSYVITGTGGFILDKLYTVIDIAADGTITVDGHFSAAAIGAGSEKLSVTVTKLGETAGTELIIPGADYAGGTDVAISAPTTAKTEGSTVNDAVDGHSYKYAMEFRNDGSALKTLTFAAVAPEGWLVAFTDSTGNLVGTTFDATGLATTTVYAMLINKTGDSSAAVPALTVTVTGGYAGDVVFDGPQEGKVSVDSASASGTGIDDKAAGLSTGFWILLVFIVILFLLIIWGGMKRGVFARRN